MEIYKNKILKNIKGEKWKSIIDFPNYEVSNMGRIKSLPRLMKRGKLGGYALSKEMIKSQRKLMGKYLITSIYDGNKSKTIYPHIEVAKAFIKNPENKPEVNHKKGIKTDNRASQLEWSTAKENTQHGIRLGLIDSNGEKCGTSKLTNEKVLEIRKLYTPSEIHWGKRIGQTPYWKIGEMYGVCAVTIKHILDRTKWKHI